ncbi:leupeptin-inactivating enzyme 1 [Magnaporthiopsis poae ATCC 64411]|uniref:Peptide hydrolase n=1 Tax=Magnaporthiopsis poae (strain ATCC 64411 / 73-15) TaxID=644358 RepID=A0A0C4DNB6_MAGP6|nr:leupeptin-inactivating enzyme 1 [Magnaporthiopsis poae ATCC 64411]
MRFGYGRTASAAAMLLSLAATVAGQQVHKPKVDSTKLQADITVENLMKNLQVLNDLAYANGGNRAFGLPGNQATVDYIFDRVSNVPGTKAWKQEFEALFNLVTSIKLTIAGADTYVYGLTYSPSTSVEGITADLVLGPEGAAGCDLANYSGLDVAGKIVLIDRFRCPTGGTLAGRVLPASKAGAAAVIVYSDVETKVTAGSLSAPSSEFKPAGFINRVDGLAAKARIEAGEKLSVYFQQTQLLENRKTHNVFVETEEGDPNNVIVLGAHHDSVQAGPGINDDASGSSLLIELFHAFTKYKAKNKVRFAWWAAEENGLVGSKHYCNTLEAAEINKILAYLNFDMQARGRIGVSDNDGREFGSVAPKGSEVIQQTYLDHFARQGVQVTPRVLTNGSDYASFWQILNKPFGFLQTGILPSEDPCYHQACDNITNIQPELLILNARAAAHQLTVLSVNGTSLIPKTLVDETKLAEVRKRTLMPSFMQLEDLQAMGETHMGCGHDI